MNTKHYAYPWKVDDVKIDWTKDTEKNARIAINDGVMTVYVSDEQLPDVPLRIIAEAYARDYDHNGNDEGYSVAEIEHFTTHHKAKFAFNGRGAFEWQTNREFVSY